jgi:hypothetical protein
MANAMLGAAVVFGIIYLLLSAGGNKAQKAIGKKSKKGRNRFIYWE